MKAARIDSHGGPEVLAFGDLPDPEPGPGRALVRVRAASLNHLDLWVRGGLPAYKVSFPHILGSDIAGEAVSFGPGGPPPGISAGDRVLVNPGVSCGKCRACAAGRENLCPSYAILGANGGWGGYAQFAVVPAENLVKIPREDLSFTAAAAIPLTFLTAWHMLKTLAPVTEGASVLVTGAGSGVGTAAIQIAKALGGRVLAASTSESKLEAARGLGADETLLVPSESLVRKARKFTGGRGLDIAFEHVGGDLFSESVRALAPGGKLVTCGATSGPEAALDLRQIFFLEKSVLGAKVGTRAEFARMMPLFAQGRLKPVVDKVFPLAEARAAQEYLAGRGQFGKVVLECP